MAQVTRPILVGHYLGASILLKYLAEASVRPAFGGLFLVATPFWDFGFAEFALTPEELSRLQTISPLVMYHSRDHGEVSFDHLEKYGQALPQAVLRALDGRGHEFNQATFPELVADIRGLADSKVAHDQPAK